MKPGQRTHTHEVIASLNGRGEAEAFSSAWKELAENLVHTREIPNGRDFLFSGDSEKLRQALKTLAEIEQRQRHQPLHLDYAMVEEYFLLRITGTHRYVDVIRGYFEEGGWPFKDFSLK